MRMFSTEPQKLNSALKPISLCSDLIFSPKLQCFPAESIEEIMTFTLKLMKSFLDFLHQNLQKAIVVYLWNISCIKLRTFQK